MFQVDSETGRAKDAETLRNYFPATNFGKIDHPAVILDQYGQILVWVLPEILLPSRRVSATELIFSVTHRA